MIWQDYVIMVVSFIFSIALIPAVRSKEKPPKSTCLITAGGLSTLVVVYMTLELWLGGTAAGLTALMWWIIFFQRRK